MKFSSNWLSDFLDLSAYSVDDIADALTAAGLETAGVERFSIPEGVRVAQIKDAGRHPNADRLSLCTVDPGDDSELAIVCGAPNVRPGMKVALATIGTDLPEMTVKKAKIRGVESYGMLCSEQELGISDEQAGIMDLPPECTIGSSLREYYPDDAIIEIELTPNRGDCLSILGVARDLAAKLGLALKDPSLTPREDGDAIDSKIEVTIENPDRCPRYMGRLVSGVTIGESPLWIKQRLRASGVRPINNVVDVTNYIMLMYGQPMHAFDYSLIANKKIVVKTAGRKAVFRTLDDSERSLIEDDLLICDGARPVALAGIMGGAGSEISDQTADVFLECAFFDPIGVRKTSKRLDLSTDSSYRFERGVDPEGGLVAALDTAAELMCRTAGGVVARGVIDEYPAPAAKKRIALSIERTNSLLGVSLDADRIIAMLQSLGIVCVGRDADGLRFEAPAFRHDLSVEADLIEEVGRLYGYDAIESSLTATVPLVRGRNSAEQILDRIRKALAFQGLHETVSNSMSSENMRELLTPEVEPVTLMNPLSPDMAQMRTTLLGSLLDITAHNINRRNLNNRFFEIGKTYAAAPGSELPRERDVVAILIEGAIWPGGWHSAPREADFFALKGILESLFDYTGVAPAVFERFHAFTPIYFAKQGAQLHSRYGVTGICGKVASSVLERFDIKTPVFYAEIDITELIQTALPWPWYTPLPRYPAIERDFSFVMPESLHSADVQTELQAVSPLIESVEPFDLYRGEKLGPDLKSVSYAVRMRAADRTLTDREAEEVCDAILSAVKRKFGIALRS